MIKPKVKDKIILTFYVLPLFKCLTIVFFLEIDIDENAWVQVEGDLYMKGYVERDTNAFVETYRQVFDLSVKVCWNDDEDEYHEADVPKDFIKECKNFIETNADFY